MRNKKLQKVYKVFYHRHSGENDLAKLSLELLNEKMELLELITRYAFTYDSGDIDGWYDLFTDDGVFSVYLPSRKEPLLLATSKEDLRQ